jgi:hypothetical protein
MRPGLVVPELVRPVLLVVELTEVELDLLVTNARTDCLRSARAARNQFSPACVAAYSAWGWVNWLPALEESCSMRLARENPMPEET